MKNSNWKKDRDEQGRRKRIIVSLARLGIPPLIIQKTIRASLSYIAEVGAYHAKCKCGKLAVEAYRGSWVCRDCYLPNNFNRDAVLNFYISRNNCMLGHYVKSEMDK